MLEFNNLNKNQALNTNNLVLEFVPQSLKVLKIFVGLGETVII